MIANADGVLFRATDVFINRRVKFSCNVIGDVRIFRPEQLGGELPDAIVKWHMPKIVPKGKAFNTGNAVCSLWMRVEGCFGSDARLNRHQEKQNSPPEMFRVEALPPQPLFERRILALLHRGNTVARLEELLSGRVGTPRPNRVLNVNRHAVRL